MRKRLSLLFVAFLTCVFLLTGKSLAGEVPDFEIDENGVLVSYNGNAENVVIPDNVYRIGDRAFIDKRIKSVVMGSNVKEIGEEAFLYCVDLLYVTAPGIVAIEDKAFYECWKMVSFDLPDTVAYIGSYAFYHCQNLRLDSDSLPVALVTIGDSAFNDCPFTKVILHENVQSIGINPFEDCDNVIFEVSSENSRYADWGNALVDSVSKTLISASLRTNINSELTTIGVHAFANLPISSVEIPSNITMVQEGAFYQCLDLTTVTWPHNCQEIPKEAFYNCRKLNSIVFTQGYAITKIGESAFLNCLELESFVFCECTTSVDDYAFSGSGLTEIDVYSTTVTFGNEVFLGVPAEMIMYGYLNSTAEQYAKKTMIFFVPFDEEDVFAIQDGILVDYIGMGGNIVIPEGVSSIAVDAFQGRSDITGVLLPNSLTELYPEAFAPCTLDMIKVKSNNPYFYSPCDEYGITGLYARHGIYSKEGNILLRGTNDGIVLYEANGIASYAFSGSNFEQITINTENSISIGANAFEGCEKLTLILTADKISGIQANAFSGIPDYAAFVGSPGTVAETYAKNNGYRFVELQADELFSYEIQVDEYDVTLVKLYGYTDCIVIPSGITRIATDALVEGISFDTSIKEIVLPETIHVLEDNAFIDCKDLVKINVPSSVTVIKGNPFLTISKSQLVLYVDEDSIAEEFAIANGYQYEYVTHTDYYPLLGNKMSLSQSITLTYVFDPEYLTHAKVTSNHIKARIVLEDGTILDNQELTTILYDGTTRAEAVQCQIPAKEMNDSFTIQLYNSETYHALSKPYSYSVAEYCNKYITLYEAGLQSGEPFGSENELELVDALMNYGKYAQIFFDYKADDIQPDEEALSSESEVLVAVTELDESYVSGDIPEGLVRVGVSLVLESEIEYRCYFMVTDADLAEPYMDELTPAQNGLYYVSKYVRICDLGDNQDFGLNEYNYEFFSTPLYYIRLCLNSSEDQNLRKLSCALYDYYAAAEAVAYGK